jgi:hypothetical protein
MNSIESKHLVFPRFVLTDHSVGTYVRRLNPDDGKYYLSLVANGCSRLNQEEAIKRTINQAYIHLLFASSGLYSIDLDILDEYQGSEPERIKLSNPIMFLEQ